MSFDGTSWVTANPSFTEPNILNQINQRSDFIKLMAGGAPRVRLGSEDKYVYIKQLAVRTKVSSGASGSNQVPSCSITTGLASAPTYLQQVRAIFDRHQEAMAGHWGVNLMDAQRLGMRQGHYQLLRNKFFFGEQPANGEGVLNGTGITTITLPADPYGATTISTYDNGAMALFLLSIVQGLKTRTFQHGEPQKIVVVGPQQVISLWQMVAIVQLVAYQRPGAGSATTAGTVQDILERNGDEIIWGYDDTLLTAGAGGTNAIVFGMPELKKQDGDGWNTNEFGKVGPNFLDNTVMYSDLAAPLEIVSPMEQGKTDMFTEIRATSGWPVRPEATTVLSAAF